MSDELEERLIELVDHISSAAPGWRKRFEFFQNADIPVEWKKLLGGYAVHAILREDNPADYPWAVQLIKDVLTLDIEHGIAEAGYVSALVRLLIILGQTEEALQWYDQLSALAGSDNASVGQAAKELRSVLCQQYPWLS